MNPHICAGKALLETFESLCILCSLSYRVWQWMEFYYDCDRHLGCMIKGISISSVKFISSRQKRDFILMTCYMGENVTS